MDIYTYWLMEKAAKEEYFEKRAGVIEVLKNTRQVSKGMGHLNLLANRNPRARSRLAKDLIEARKKPGGRAIARDYLSHIKNDLIPMAVSGNRRKLVQRGVKGAPIMDRFKAL